MPLRYTLQRCMSSDTLVRERETTIYIYLYIPAIHPQYKCVHTRNFSSLRKVDNISNFQGTKKLLKVTDVSKYVN